MPKAMRIFAIVVLASLALVAVGYVALYILAPQFTYARIVREYRDLQSVRPASSGRVRSTLAGGPLDATDISMYRSSEHYYQVDGTIKNTSDRTQCLIQVYITLHDDAGRFIANDSTYIDDQCLPPSGTTTYKLYVVAQSGIASVKVDHITSQQDAP